MYTIIGGDGREYGPVSAEQVRQWIAAGRANGQTRAKVFGTEEWKTLHDFSDFNPASHTAGFEPNFDEPTAATGASAIPTSNAATFDPIECFSRSWELLKRNFWPFIAIPIVGGLLAQAPGLILKYVLPGTQIDPSDPFRLFHTSTFWLTLWLPLLISQPISAGLVYYFVKKARGEEADFGDLFAGFRRGWVPIILSTIVSLIFITLGFFFLILPGIYLLVAYMFANLVIIDRQCGFWEGMEISRRAITRRWWTFLLLLIISMLVLLIGFCALLIGIFVALPVILGAMAYAYLDLVPRSAGPAADQVIQGDLPRPEGEQDHPGV